MAIKINDELFIGVVSIKNAVTGQRFNRIALAEDDQMDLADALLDRTDAIKLRDVLSGLIDTGVIP